MTFVVRRENESFDNLLRRFRQKVTQDGIMSELRKRRYHITKGEQERIAKRKGTQRAIRRRRRHNRNRN